VLCSTSHCCDCANVASREVGSGYEEEERLSLGAAVAANVGSEFVSGKTVAAEADTTLLSAVPAASGSVDISCCTFDSKVLFCCGRLERCSEDLRCWRWLFDNGDRAAAAAAGVSERLGLGLELGLPPFFLFEAEVAEVGDDIILSEF
jgi:hypothetical protein